MGKYLWNKNLYRKTGNRTQYLMIGSQELSPVAHDVVHYKLNGDSIIVQLLSRMEMNS